MKTSEQKATAKQVSIIEVLASFGHKPAEKVGNQLVYFSPFRDERTASFFVNPKKNVFKDFASDGGDVIKLVMYLKNVGYPQAIDYLLAFDGSGVELPELAKQAAKEHKPKHKLELISIDTLRNQQLIEYGHSRGIDTDILIAYCHEVTYKNNDRFYKAIGFKNISNGFELRMGIFKSCMGVKDISIPVETQYSRAAIFEGFFDFLSYCQLLRKKDQCFIYDDIIVLNSLTMLSKLDFSKYAILHLYLDNDESGKKAAEKIKKTYNLKTVVDRSVLYQNYKDLNEFLIATKKDY